VLFVLVGGLGVGEEFQNLDPITAANSIL